MEFNIYSLLVDLMWASIFLFAAKLLRTINNIEKALEDKDNEKALELVRELKEDTQKDIEA